MPFLWVDYGKQTVLSTNVYLRFEDCVSSIQERILDNPDAYTDIDRGARANKEDCKKDGYVMYIFYDNYRKQIQIHWVNVV